MAKKKGISVTLVLAVGFVLLALFSIAMIGGMFSTTDKAKTGEGSEMAGAQCNANLETTAIIKWYNSLNDNTKEQMNISGNLYMVVNGEEVLVKEFNNVAEINEVLECGKTYRLRNIGANGIDAKIVSVRSGEAKVIDDGKAIEFSTSGNQVIISLNGKRHADVLLFRGFDIDANDYMSDNVDSDKTNYEASGVIFSSPAGTPFNVGVGDTLTLKFDVKANDSYTDFSDFGYYILVKATDKEYDAPVLKLGGVELRDVKGTLTDYENRAFSDYDYVYYVDSSLTKSGETLNLVISALSDTDATQDLAIDFATLTGFRSVKSDAVLYGAVNDGDRSFVFSKQGFVVDIQ